MGSFDSPPPEAEQWQALIDRIGALEAALRDAQAAIIDLGGCDGTCGDQTGACVPTRLRSVLPDEKAKKTRPPLPARPGHGALFPVLPDEREAT